MRELVRPRLLVRVLVVGVVVAAVVALVRGWGGTGAQLRSADPAWAGLALLLGLGNVLAAALAWRAALLALGSALPLRPAVAVFCTGQLGKYVPGSVWPLLLQAQLAAAHGVPRSRVVVAGIVALAEGLAAGLAVGLLAAPGLLAGAGPWAAAGAAGLAVAGLLLAASPTVVGRAVGLLLRWTRRPPLEAPPDRRRLARVLGTTTVGALLLAGHGAALAAAVGLPPRACLAAGGGLVLASVAGLLAVPVPAGLGVREAVLVAVLAPVAPVEAALAVAVLSRLVLTAADLGAALLGALLQRGRTQSAG